MVSGTRQPAASLPASGSGGTGIADPHASGPDQGLPARPFRSPPGRTIMTIATRMSPGRARGETSRSRGDHTKRRRETANRSPIRSRAAAALLDLGVEEGGDRIEAALDAVVTPVELRTPSRSVSKPHDDRQTAESGSRSVRQGQVSRARRTLEATMSRFDDAASGESRPRFVEGLRSPENR